MLMKKILVLTLIYLFLSPLYSRAQIIDQLPEKAFISSCQIMESDRYFGSGITLRLLYNLEDRNMLLISTNENINAFLAVIEYDSGKEPFFDALGGVYSNILAQIAFDHLVSQPFHLVEGSQQSMHESPACHLDYCLMEQYERGGDSKNCE